MKFIALFLLLSSSLLSQEKKLCPNLTDCDLGGVCANEKLNLTINRGTYYLNGSLFKYELFKGSLLLIVHDNDKYPFALINLKTCKPIPVVNL